MRRTGWTALPIFAGLIIFRIVLLVSSHTSSPTPSNIDDLASRYPEAFASLLQNVPSDGGQPDIRVTAPPETASTSAATNATITELIGWPVAYDRDTPLKPAVLCAKPVLPASAKPEGLHERRWGSPAEGMSETVYYFAHGETDIKPLVRAAAATAASCKQYKAGGTAYTPIEKPSFTTLDSTPLTATVCDTGTAANSTPDYTCTVVLSSGRYLVVATVWSKRQHVLNELVPRFLDEINTRLDWVGP